MTRLALAMALKDVRLTLFRSAGLVQALLLGLLLVFMFSLSQKAGERVSAQTAAYLFAADRAEHLWGQGGIVDQTKNGLTVVSDRYLFSNLAYQGVTCGEDLPKTLNSPFPLPQLLFFFDISAKKSLERVEKRGEAKEIYENEKFLCDTASRYRAIIDRYKKLENSGMRIVELDATLPKEKISDLIWKEILPIINS